MSWPPNEMPQTIRNRTFDEIAVGDSAAIERTLTLEHLRLFALMSGEWPNGARSPACCSTCSSRST
jgi:hypothetical protein